jgi:hypothetical protein
LLCGPSTQALAATALCDAALNKDCGTKPAGHTANDATDTNASSKQATPNAIQAKRHRARHRKSIAPSRDDLFIAKSVASPTQTAGKKSKKHNAP